MTLSIAFAFTLAVSAADQVQSQARLLQLGSTASGSTVLDRTAGVSVRDVTLQQALFRLTESSGVIIAFSPSLLTDDRGLVSCDCATITLGAALRRLLAGTGFDFTILAGQVVLTPGFLRGSLERGGGTTLGYQHVHSIRPFTGPIPTFPGFPVPADDQATSVAGIVVNQGGRPLAGATVSVTSTTAHSVTDASGRFRIANLSATEVTLRVTMIGYRPMTRLVHVGTQDVRIELVEAPLNLDELVVTGTVAGTQRRAIGNAVSRIDVTELKELAPPSDVQSLFAARVPGVRIMRGSGNVGSGGNTFVRGVSSMALSNEPLLYVDGVRVDNTASTQTRAYSGGGDRPSRINELNPQDIESIEIIKGPAAATLYGTEASAGVIQIITKRGRAGKPRAELGVRQGLNFLQDPIGKYPRNFYKDAAGQVQSFSVLADDLATGYGSPFTTGHPQGYGISVSGGTDALRYYTGIDYDRDVGIVDYNWLNKLSARANLAYSFGSKLDAVVSVGTLRSKNRSGTAVQPITQHIISAQAANRSTRLRGYLSRLPEWFEVVHGIEDIDRTIGSVNLTHRPMTWLTQRLTVGTDIGTARSSRLIERDPLGAQGPWGTSSLGEKIVGVIRSSYTTIDYGATAVTQAGSSLAFSTSIGAQYYSKQFVGDSAGGTVFPVPGVETVSATATRSAGEDFAENKTFGVFGQEQVAWRDRLFVTAAVRGDDNSAFGKNYEFVVYPKLSVSWVLSEEPSLKMPFVNTLKLRAAWGRAGQQPDVFAATQLFAAATGQGAVPTLTPLNVGNPDLKPEVGEELELGFDATLFSERATLEFTHYRKRTFDAIVAQQVVPSVGFPGTQFVNIGEMRTRGIEVGLTATPVLRQSLAWEVGFNLTTSHNLILDLGNATPPSFGFSGRQRHVKGFPAGAVFGKRVLSATLNSDGTVSNAMCEGGAAIGGGGSPVPCSQAAEAYWGPPTPTWFGSASSTITLFRNLRLFGLVDFLGGNIRGDNDLAASHLFWNSSEASVRRNDPILEAYRIVIGSSGQEVGFVNPGFAKLRMLSTSYVIPGSLARKLFRAAGGTITLSLDNVADLWKAQAGTFGRNSVDHELKDTLRNSSLNVFNQEKLPTFTRLAFTTRLTF